MSVQPTAFSPAPVDPAPVRPRADERDRSAFTLPDEAPPREADKAVAADRADRPAPTKPAPNRVEKAASGTRDTAAPAEREPAKPAASDNAAVPKAQATDAKDKAAPVATATTAPALDISALVAIAAAEVKPATPEGETTAASDGEETLDEAKSASEAGDGALSAAEPALPVLDPALLATAPATADASAPAAFAPAPPPTSSVLVPAPAQVEAVTATVAAATGVIGIGQAATSAVPSARAAPVRSGLGPSVDPGSASKTAVDLGDGNAGTTVASEKAGASAIQDAPAKQAAAAPVPAAEFKAAEAVQPGPSIDLSALVQHPVKHEASGATLPVDQAAAQQGAQSQGQVASGQPTPLHVLPIEIGMKAMTGVKQFEIRLDPAELGRVDVKLDISDTGEVSARLVVDRVETLHLLQRDSRTLERAFEQAGLKPSDAGVEISLRDRPDDSAFRQQRQQDDAPRRRRGGEGDGDQNDIAISAHSAPLRRFVRLGGVDLSI